MQNVGLASRQGVRRELDVVVSWTHLRSARGTIASCALRLACRSAVIAFEALPAPFLKTPTGMKNEPDTWDDCATCIQCGSLLWPELDRSYHPSSDESLCFECSEARGGVYDPTKHRWATPPDLSGLVTRDAAS